MSKLRSQIYTRRDYEQVKELQRRLHDLLPIVDDAEQCGVECQDYRQYLEETAEFLQRIETKFMSPPPRK